MSPYGELYEITFGDQRAVVSESGATLRVYDVGDRHVVDPFDGPETPARACEGEILAPWPNRVVDGRWTWDGVDHQLAITEPGRGHALHGLVRNLPWQVEHHADDSVTLTTEVLTHQGWPFPLAMTAAYELSRHGLRSTITAANIGRTPCPYGVAVHPYLYVPDGRVDDVVLRIPAATWLDVDDRLAPTEKQSVAGTPFDLNDDTPLGTRQIDHAFTDLERLPNGRVEATMTAADGRATTVWGNESVTWWQLFTGDGLWDPWIRRTLALEPMTCAPNALNSGDGIVVLEPGESHTMTWGLALS